jgi:mediator of replication checkpoint protein 1
LCPSEARLTSVAQNPKQQAFFHAIEDREDSQMLDFIEDGTLVPDSQADESQDAAPAQAGAVARPALSAISANILRPGRGSLPTATLKKPTTIEDIRDSVAAFFDDPVVPDSQPPPSDDGDEEGADDDVDAIHPLSRTDTSASADSAASRPGIVNRLHRASAAAGDADSGEPLAFAANGASAGAPAFKMPSLLRRTTNLSTASTSSKSSTSSGGSSGGAARVRVGGSKKSNMHYQAYEAERKRAVEEAERRRSQQLKKTVLATKGRGIMGFLRKEGSGFE